MSRDHKLEIRVDDRELAQIRERAVAAGVKVSEYLRARALGHRPRPAAVVNSKARKGIRTRRSSKPAAKQEPTAPVATRSAEESFVVDRAAQLVEQGRMPVIAREEARAEWRNRVRRGLV